MKNLFLFTILILVLHGCSVKKAPGNLPQKVTFTNINISYSDGWERHFEIIVDSGKIFFTPQVLNITYGIMPDSIFTLVDSVAAAVLRKKTKVYKKRNCEDCPVIAIMLVAGNDTFRIMQENKEIESSFIKITAPLYFLTRKKYPAIPDLHMLWDTRKMIRGMPPPFR